MDNTLASHHYDTSSIPQLLPYVSRIVHWFSPVPQGFFSKASKLFCQKVKDFCSLAEVIVALCCRLLTALVESRHVNPEVVGSCLASLYFSLFQTPTILFIVGLIAQEVDAMVAKIEASFKGSAFYADLTEQWEELKERFPVGEWRQEAEAKFEEIRESEDVQRLIAVFNEIKGEVCGQAINQLNTAGNRFNQNIYIYYKKM